MDQQIPHLAIAFAEVVEECFPLIPSDSVVKAALTFAVMTVLSASRVAGEPITPVAAIAEVARLLAEGELGAQLAGCRGGPGFGAKPTRGEG